MFVMQINQPLQRPQTDEQKVQQMDNLQLKKAASSSNPEIRKLAAWEYASRLAAMPDKTSREFSEGIDFLLKLAEKAPAGAVRLVLCASALAVASGTPQLSSVQDQIINIGGDPLLQEANTYLSTYSLRTINSQNQPTPKPSQTQSQSGTYSPVKSNEQAERVGQGVEVPTYLQLWPGQDLLQLFLETKDFSMDPVNFKLQRLFANYAGSSGAPALQGATGTLLQNFYDQSGRTLLQLPGKAADYVAAGKAFVAAVDPSYFDDFNFGGVAGNGQKAINYLNNGQLDEFFKMLAQNPDNPLAADLISKAVQGSFQYYNTHYMGTVDLFLDWGSGGLRARLQNNQYMLLPFIFFNGVPGQINFFERDLHARNVEFSANPAEPAKLTDPIDLNAQNYLQYRLGGSFLFRFNSFGSFFVEPSLSYANAPTRIQLNKQKPGVMEGLDYAGEAGWSLRISNTDPHTGYTYRPDRWMGLDFSRSLIHPDLDVLLQKDQGNPLAVFTYLKARSKFVLGASSNQTESPDNRLGSYDVLYLETGIRSQWQESQPASNILMFVPRWTHAFSSNVSLTASAQAGYNMGQDRIDQAGGELRLIVKNLYFAGGLNFVNQNYTGFDPAAPTFKLSIGYSPGMVAP
ncbi:Uncharacterised protein [uncultured archaeon]|nr:Uncharacterised protein [uncultured archaeon]